MALFPQYLFCHIPKTAGTSFITLLRRLLGADQVAEITLNKAGEDYTYLTPAQFEPYRLLVGHFGVKWHDYIGPNRLWLTALRDPVERVLSTYYYWRNNVAPAPSVPYLHLAQTLTLEEFARCGHPLVLQGIANTQTWQLACDFRIEQRTMPDEQALAQAKQNLKRFAFIGFCEDFRGSAARLCSLLQVNMPAELPRENTTLTRPPVETISADTIQAIKDINRLDLQLYRYAQQLVSGAASASRSGN